MVPRSMHFSSRLLVDLSAVVLHHAMFLLESNNIPHVRGKKPAKVVSAFHSFREEWQRWIYSAKIWKWY